MSVSFLVVDRCGDEVAIDGQRDVEEWNGCLCDFYREFERWMEIGNEINECLKLFTWKGSGTNDIIYVPFNEVRNGTFVLL